MSRRGNATYAGGGGFAGSSGTLAGGQTVKSTGTRATTTMVTTSDNPVVFGQPVTFTATVSPQSPIPRNPSGTVQFQADGNNLGSPVTVTSFGSQTTATLTTTALSGGTHTITAIYSGDSNYSGSTGVVEPFAVGAGTSMTTTVIKDTNNVTVTSHADPSLERAMRKTP